MSMLDARHRYPWVDEEESFLLRAKTADPKVTHKMIARELQRTPRSIDQHVHDLKKAGRL
jgi:predicted transcriptional regulator